MGYKNVDQETKKSASYLISSINDNTTPEQWERNERKKEEWHRLKFILHPDVYSHELKSFLINDLPETLHNYVRGHMTGASERLTKKKIRQVVSALSQEQADWWQGQDFKYRFWDKLVEMYPSCCDGQLE